MPLPLRRVIEHGWPSQSWLTFRQAQEAGGCVRKGEHGVTVVYADRFTPESEKERASREGGDPKAVPFLKRFTVFNVAQCEGLRAGLASDPAPLPEREIVPVAEEVIAASGVDFRIGGSRAFYVPSLDFVQVPPQPAFFEQVNYYRTCLHELTHATGHASRSPRCRRGGLWAPVLVPASVVLAGLGRAGRARPAIRGASSRAWAGRSHHRQPATTLGGARGR